MIVISRKTPLNCSKYWRIELICHHLQHLQGKVKSFRNSHNHSIKSSNLSLRKLEKLKKEKSMSKARKIIKQKMLKWNRANSMPSQVSSVSKYYLMECKQCFWSHLQLSQHQSPLILHYLRELNCFVCYFANLGTRIMIWKIVGKVKVYWQR